MLQQVVAGLKVVEKFPHKINGSRRTVEKEMSEYQKKKEEKRKQFFKKCSDKIRKGELIYQALALYIAKRYNIDTDYLPNVIYIILNHYIENIEEDFETWIHKENSPLLRPAEQLPKIFPEIAVITTNEEQIIKIANNLYNLTHSFHYQILRFHYHPIALNNPYKIFFEQQYKH